MRARNFGLDLLRAIAITSVLLCHANQCVVGIPRPLARCFERGWMGVDLFFVLSGFLIASQKKDLSVSRFWIRRWTRTLPLYFVVLFAYAVVKPCLAGQPFGNIGWRYLFFLQNTGELRDFVQSWSLCIEEQFYLVFPLVLVVVGTASRFAWLVPMAVSIAIRACLLPSVHGLTDARLDSLIRFNTLAHLDGLSAGIFLAATQDQWRAWSPRLKGLSALAGCLLVGAAITALPYGESATGDVLCFSLLALGFGAMLVGVIDWKPLPGTAAGIERIALWSYGAYLWNNLFIRLLAHHPFGSSWILGMLAFLGGTLALSWITFVAIEKPGMALRGALNEALGRRLLRSPGET